MNVSNRIGTTWRRWRRWQSSLGEPLPVQPSRDLPGRAVLIAAPVAGSPESSDPASTGEDQLEPIRVEAHLSPEIDRLVPLGLQVAAGWCWRVIAIVIVAVGLVWMITHLTEVAIPLAVAILLTALLTPIARRLRKWGLPKGLATPITVIGGLAVVAGVLTLIGSQIAGQSNELGDQVVKGFDQVVAYLETGPLKIDTSQVSGYVDRLQKFVIDSRSTIATYAAEIGTQVGHFVAGFAITIFALFYFLADGRGIWSFLLKFFPRGARQRVDNATLKGWVSLTSYVRATVIVAAVDGLGVLAAAFFIGVPLFPALGALVFIGAFVPIVGALVSGMVAVLVALVFLGWFKALIMLICVVGVMQLEGHILQPFLLGRAVKLHPLAVLLAIAIGVVVGGIVGALLAVPLLAFTKTFVADLVNEGGEVVDSPTT